MTATQRRCARRLGILLLLSLPWAAAVAATERAPATPAAAPATAAQFRGIERIVAFADVHGAFNELAQLLRESGVVDGELRWSGGRTHLVSTGDLLDRGADSRKVMDLLMRLQREAAAAGGAVHVVLGNHEAMNLLGDLRYVTPDEFAAYADLEPPELRAQARHAWALQQGAASVADFDSRFPPGYFGHRAAFAPKGPYGHWLLALPVAVVINDTLFMHGGPSDALRGLGLDALNLRYRTALTDYLGLADRVEHAGLIRPEDAFRDRPRLAAERLAAPAPTANPAPANPAPAPELAAEVQRFTQADDNPLLSTDGPNWYRGAALCNEVAETDTLAPLLQQFGVARVVIGHTVTRNQRAVTRFDGRVIKLDTGMNRAAFKGRPTSLTFEGGRITARYAGEPAPVALDAEPLYVAPNSMPDAQVAEALAQGSITSGATRPTGEQDLVIEHQGRRIPAVFIAGDRSASATELAAYRLDRLLGLGIVPATVSREVDGKTGVVQARPAKWVTQGDVQRQSLRGGGWCPLEPQFQLVYAFDALVGNEGRTPETLLFDAEEWYVYVTRHERAFGNLRGLPAYLKAKPPTPGAELRRRLGQLNDAKLVSALGDAADARARKALLERRDGLLALPAAAAGAGR